MYKKLLKFGKTNQQAFQNQQEPMSWTNFRVAMLLCWNKALSWAAQIPWLYLTNICTNKILYKLLNSLAYIFSYHSLRLTAQKESFRVIPIWEKVISLVYCWMLLSNVLRGIQIACDQIAQSFQNYLDFCDNDASPMSSKIA